MCEHEISAHAQGETSRFHGSGEKQTNPGGAWKSDECPRGMAGVWLPLVLLLLAVLEADSRTLTILALLPSPEEEPPRTEWRDGPAMLPAVQLAAEHVNQQRGLLEGFPLRVVSGEGRCDQGGTDSTYVSFVEKVLLTRHPVMGIVGLTCAPSSSAVRGLAGREELAISSIHSSLSSRIDSVQWNYAFSITGSTLGLATESLRFLEAVGWSSIAVLYTANTMAQDILQVKAEFISLLRNTSVSIDIATTVSSTHVPFALIKQRKTRIIFLFLDSHLAQTVACLALSESITYPNYQLIWVSVPLVDLNATVNVQYAGQTLKCSLEDMIGRALNGSVFLNYKLTPSDPHNSSVSNYTYHQFSELYQERLGGGLQPNSLSGLMYDSVWALALALNYSIQHLPSYQYGMPHITSQITHHMLSTPFRGVSGNIDVFQQERNIEIFVLINGKREPINITDIPEEIFVADSFKRVHPNIVPPAIFTVLAVVLLELVLVSATHLVTCFCRRERSIKAQSTQLNHFIFAGTYLFILGSLLYLQIKRETLDQMSASIICHATWPWVLSIGFTLIVGTVTVREWRVYRIFVHYRRPGPFISNTALVVMVLLQLLVDLAISVVWSLLDPIQATVTAEEVREEGGAVFIQIERSCISSNTLIWACSLITWKVLQLLSMFNLALLNRKVKNKDFSTQNVQVASYLLTLATVLGSILYLSLFLNRSNILWNFVVLCSVFIIIIGVCYCSILLPPVLRAVQRKYRADPPTSVRRMTSTIAPQIKKASTLLRLPRVSRDRTTYLE